MQQFNSAGTLNQKIQTGFVPLMNNTIRRYRIDFRRHHPQDVSLVASLKRQQLVRDVSADAGFLCDKAAVHGEASKEGPWKRYYCYYACHHIMQGMYNYTGCNRRNGPDFGRVFLRSNYTDITQNTYIQS